MKGYNQQNTKSQDLLIWCSSEPPPTKGGLTILWQSFSSNESQVSIPYLVEQNSDILKDKLLKWVYELGKQKINQNSIIDSLEIRKGLSYWWMTTFAEKSCHTTSSRIYDATRLLVLEELINCNSTNNLILATNDRTITKIIKDLCRSHNINFKHQTIINTAKNKFFTKKAYKYLFHPIQAVLYLVQSTRQKWKLRESKKYTTSMLKSEVVFFDFFAQINQKNKQLHSNIWTSLANHLSKSNISVTWVHRYIPHTEIPSATSANKLLAKLNNDPDGLNHHILLDSNLNFLIICSSLLDYCKLVFKSIKIRSLKKYFQPQNSKLNLWLLFKPEWIKSLRGIDAIENCLVLNIIEQFIRSIPRQKIGFYTQENQPWEMALVYAWRKFQHGEIIGVQHSTVRYWDLRYFFDPRIYTNQEKNNLPLPNLMAVNSPNVIQNYINLGYKKSLYIKTEALRYLYLNKCTLKQNRRDLNEHRILICGDNRASLNTKIMTWLSIALDNLPNNIHYLYKPHPTCRKDNIKPFFSKISTLQSTTSPLIDLLSKSDIVISSHISSVVLEAYLLGLPVIQILEGDLFNLSPIRGEGEVFFVKSPQELASAIKKLIYKKPSSTKEYFYLDDGLPHWEKLLKNLLYKTVPS